MIDPNPWRRIANLTRSEVNELQSHKLSSFINQYVYPFSLHYKKLFDDHKIDPRSIKTVADLRRIPFTSKKDFVDSNDKPDGVRDFVLQPDKAKIQKAWGLDKKLPLLANALLKGKDYAQEKLFWEFRPVFLTFTTGTTNRPIPFMYSNYDIESMYLSGSRMMSLFNVDKSKPVVNIFPFAPHLAFWQVVFGGFAANTLVLSTGGGKTVGTEANIAAIEKMKPSMILGVPSYIYHLLRLAAERNCKMPYLKKIVLGAARCTTAFKMRLVELAESMGASGVSVFGTYGFTEARAAWCECPTSADKSSGYFLYPDKEIFEIIDPDTGEVKKDGEDGEIVYTSIDARGSVVIRYRTGDFVKGGITYAKCPYTGYTVPRLSNDITRLSDIKDLQLSKVKGTLINMSLFFSMFSEIEEVEEWQIELCKRNNDPFDMDEFVVYVSCPGEVNRPAVSEKITQKIFSIMEVKPNRVEFLPLPDMIKRVGLETENKDKRIVDKRPKV